ncbi:hypothetical protein AOLI_G00215660 [Acnodon oligacanthus]
MEVSPTISSWNLSISHTISGSFPQGSYIPCTKSQFLLEGPKPPRASPPSPTDYMAPHRSPKLDLAGGRQTWPPPRCLFGLSPAGLRGLPSHQALTEGRYPQAWLQG